MDGISGIGEQHWISLIFMVLGHPSVLVGPPYWVVEGTRKKCEGEVSKWAKSKCMLLHFDPNYNRSN